MNHTIDIPLQESDWFKEIQDPLKKKMPAILRGLMDKLLYLPELRSLYNQTRSQMDSQPFWENLLKALGVSYRVSKEDMKRIPVTGPLVIVANHPFGAIEGLVLASMLCLVRTDVKILANSVLEPIPELRDIFVYVDPFGGTDAIHHNIHPLRSAMRWLKCGGVLAAFPAGEVAHINLKRATITDPDWKDTIARLARTMGIPVLPVYFCGTNSPLFQVLGLFHPMIRTALLTREMLNKRNCSLEIRIGRQIPFQRLRHFISDRDATEYLRERTYLLERRAPSSRISPKKSGKLNRHAEPVIPIAPADDPCMLERDISGLEEENILVRKGDVSVMHANAWQIPGILNEIGRQREIAFRNEGEGSGKSLDLDNYDEHYQHIFLWNETKKVIDGAYRIGCTDLILNKSGLDGLYVHSLFRLRLDFFKKLGPSLELGRSFVRQECQRDNRSLPLLWEGIAGYVARHPKYRYLYGPVSISNDYRPISWQLMACFLQSKYLMNVRPFGVAPANPLSFSGAEARRARSYCERIQNLDDLSDLISDIETDSKGVPVLLRHYIKLGAKVLAFNVDPAFGNCLDILMLIDLARVDARKLDRLMGKSASVHFRLCHGTYSIEPISATC